MRGVLRIASHNVLFGTVMVSPSADAPLSSRTEVLLIGRRALNRYAYWLCLSLFLILTIHCSNFRCYLLVRWRAM